MVGLLAYRRMVRVSAVRIIVIALAVITAVVPTPAAWVERFYSRQFYLVLQNVMTQLSSLVSFALFDLLVGVVLIGLVGWWASALQRAGAGRRWRAAARMVLNTATVVAGLYLVFVGVWGLNYRREPLTVKLDYDQRRVTSQALVRLAEDSVGHLNDLFDKTGGTRWPTLGELPGRLAPAFQRVQRRLGVSRTAIVGVPKATLLTSYFRRAGIDGMMNPFSLEILVNETVMPYERPFVVAHEWSHLAGYAHEAEASFVGWLTCLAGDDVSRYSGWLFLTPHLLRNLPATEREGMWASIDDGPRQHLQAIAQRLDQAVPVVRRSANRVYDRFLRANRVEEGIASYGLVVDLALGTAVAEGFPGPQGDA